MGDQFRRIEGRCCFSRGEVLDGLTRGLKLLGALCRAAAAVQQLDAVFTQHSDICDLL